MTDIRKLMEECAPLPWTGVIAHATDWDEHDGTVPLTIHFDGTCRDENGDDEDFILTAVNALPAVLEYMENGHAQCCGALDAWGCTCGYDALAKALGIEE